MSTSRQYELVYIVTPEATDQEIADLHTQIGQIVERFGSLAEAGAQHILVSVRGVSDVARLERIGAEVLPQLR